MKCILVSVVSVLQQREKLFVEKIEMAITNYKAVRGLQRINACF
jgi:hypothetical protein